MTVSQISSILGETGTARTSGGCVAPMSLSLTFTIEVEEVRIDGEDKRLTTGPKTNGIRRISHERYLSFVEDVKAALENRKEPKPPSTAQLGVAVNLPSPSGAVRGSAQEMLEEGPDPYGLARLIEGLAAEAWSEHETPEPEEEKAVVAVSKIIGYAPFLLPLTVFVLAGYFALRTGSDVGGQCDIFDSCATGISCNITDTGVGGLFGTDGYCTSSCSETEPCPSGMVCSPSTVTLPTGTRWTFHYERHKGNFCVPAQ